MAVRSLGDMFDAYERANVSAGRLRVVGSSPNIVSPKQPIATISTQPGIEFDHIHFSYNNSTNVLNGVNFTIPHGQTVGWLGLPALVNQPSSNAYFGFTIPPTGK